jgi:hypothetical protein
MVSGEMGRGRNGKRKNWEGEKEDAEGKTLFNLCKYRNADVHLK